MSPDDAPRVGILPGPPEDQAEARPRSAVGPLGPIFSLFRDHFDHLNER